MDGNVRSWALVTGGTGFVARRLIRRLLDDGYRVRATYRANLPPADAGGRLEWVRVADIGPQTAWQEALHDVDAVFHLAGLAHQLDASQSALVSEYERVNAQGTRQLAASMAQERRPMRMVLLSSIGAVCSTSRQTVRSDTPERPDTPYGHSKLLAEKLMKEVCRTTAVEWCVVRAPLVYGPGAPGNLQRLIRLVALKVPVPLGRATARRSMVFVDNLVDALVACARAAAASGQTFLVADQESISVAELVALMAELRGSTVRLVSVPPRAVSWMAAVADRFTGGARDASGRYARAVQLLFGGLTIDASHLHNSLRWRPPHTLREGLALTLREGGK